MAYFKPPFFVAKVFNRIAMRTGIGGSETLTVTGRSTGKPQRIPVITLDHDGARYLVSARGESQWVRNVRANPTVTVAGKGGNREYHATEVPTSGRSPIISAYRVRAGKTVEAYWKELPNAEDHPVFLLV